MTLKELRLSIRAKLQRDVRWAKRATQVIYEKQTGAEQAGDITLEYNTVGFTAYDAPIMSPIARKVIRNKPLTFKESCTMRRIIPKYWKQLLNISGREKMEEILLKERRIT